MTRPANSENAKRYADIVRALTPIADRLPPNSLIAIGPEYNTRDGEIYLVLPEHVEFSKPEMHRLHRAAFIADRTELEVDRGEPRFVFTVSDVWLDGMNLHAYLTKQLEKLHPEGNSEQ